MKREVAQSHSAKRTQELLSQSFDCFPGFGGDSWVVRFGEPIQCLPEPRQAFRATDTNGVENARLTFAQHRLADHLQRGALAKACPGGESRSADVGIGILPPSADRMQHFSAAGWFPPTQALKRGQ